jgi:hypothetical protein
LRLGFKAVEHLLRLENFPAGKLGQKTTFCLSLGKFKGAVFQTGVPEQFILYLGEETAWFGGPQAPVGLIVHKLNLFGPVQWAEQMVGVNSVFVQEGGQAKLFLDFKGNRTVFLSPTRQYFFIQAGQDRAAKIVGCGFPTCPLPASPARVHPADRLSVRPASSGKAIGPFRI